MVRLHHLLITWQAVLLTPKAKRDYLVVGALLLFTFLLDFAMQRNWRRYFSRTFLTDFTYYLLYYGGFYTLLYSPVGKALDAGITRYVPWMRIGLLAHLPVAAQVVAFIVISDFLSYWQHRWMHVSRPLWAIHQIHHSQSEMTIFTNYRFHLFEETFRRFFGLIPFAMLGAPPAVWLWADLVMSWVLLMQHSSTHWSYGWLDRVFVSPRYHEVHHAADAELHDHNFSALFSIWDRLFGTRHETEHAERYGVEPAIPEGFFVQMMIPMRDWWSALRRNERPLLPVVSTPSTEQETAA